jgi:biotin operon repressor
METAIPAVKPMLVPFINQERTGIRVGGYQANITREVYVDDVENFYHLLTEMDGEHSAEYLKAKFGLSSDDLDEIVDSLRENGILYQNDFNPYKFTPEEREYYSRNLNFFAWIDVEGRYLNYWKVQDKLKNSSVLILGAGGTGSNCAEGLARLGVGSLTLLDLDRVEISNLNRQDFEYADVGKWKTEALRERLNRINPFIEIKTLNKEIARSNDISDIQEHFDIVICCIDHPDNFADILDEYNSITGTPWILGGYASTIMTHGIYGRKEMHFSEYLRQERRDNYDARTVDEEVDWKWDNAIISSVAATSGYISALYCMYYLTELKDLQYGKVQHIDLYNIQNLKDFSYILGAGE